MTCFHSSSRLGTPRPSWVMSKATSNAGSLCPSARSLAALTGYADYFTDKVGQRLVGSYALINEAFRRRRQSDSPGQRVMGKLLGVEVDQAIVDKGRTFVAGVVERAGEEGLARLWQTAATLPTPAEVDAPGLWLARIELPPEGS